MKDIARKGKGNMEKELILLQPLLSILPDTPDYRRWESEIMDYRREFLEKGNTQQEGPG